MPALLWMMHCLLLAKGRHERPSVPFGGIGVGLMHVCVKYSFPIYNLVLLPALLSGS
jgi:hypothetical protein